MWREQESIQAVRDYVRIFAGLVFLALFVALVIMGRFDEELVVKILVGALGAFHVGMGAIGRTNKPSV